MASQSIFLDKLVASGAHIPWQLDVILFGFTKHQGRLNTIIKNNYTLLQKIFLKNIGGRF